MRTLFLNTATQTTAVGIFEEDLLISEARWAADHDEAEKLQPAVDSLLRKNRLTPDDIDQLVVCIGPAGFTSIRIGVSAVNAWSFAKEVPVATVSVFDLFGGKGDITIVAANQKEAWVAVKGQEPDLVDQAGFVKLGLKTFSFGGLLNDAWKTFLQEHAGTFVEMEEQLPLPSKLSFSRNLVDPWYYKDPNITWSDRVHGKR